MSNRKVSLLISFVALLVWVQPAAAKVYEGHLVVHSNPKQAYVYADGEPVVESLGHFIRLSPGQHRIDLYNFGYKPETRTVTVESHKTLHLRVDMQPVPGGGISGPWGCITLKGAPRAAVLLNGKDPEIFFVGHGDEFDNEFIWKQELIVPPGKHLLTVEWGTRSPWSTTVEVQANQRVVVDAYKGVHNTVAWSRGEQLKELPRFKPGIASTEVVVPKVGGMFSASTGEVNCGDSADLKWSSSGAAKVELNGQPVGPSGQQTVEPKKTTSYHFTAAGPGGVYTSDATVNVNPQVTASLNVSPEQVRYNQAGEAVGSGTPTVTWSATHADSVSIDPIGSVGASGSQAVQVTPPSGPGVQTVTYTLHATNACGGSETRTASLQIEGPPPVQQAAAPPPPAPAESAPVESAALAMPHAASNLPLVALFGLLSLCAGAVVMFVAKHVA
jgi:hypothetical protein